MHTWEKIQWPVCRHSSEEENTREKKNYNKNWSWKENNQAKLNMKMAIWWRRGGKRRKIVKCAENFCDRIECWEWKVGTLYSRHRKQTSKPHSSVVLSNLRHNASMRSSHCSVHISTTSTVEENHKENEKRKKLPAYIKKCLILWIPLNWLRKSDGMSGEWTSAVGVHLLAQFHLCARFDTTTNAIAVLTMTIHTFIAIITRLLWPKKDSSLAHLRRAIWLRGKFYCESYY